jgi:hypothetical protein
MVGGWKRWWTWWWKQTYLEMLDHSRESCRCSSDVTLQHDGSQKLQRATYIQASLRTMCATLTGLVGTLTWTLSPAAHRMYVSPLLMDSVALKRRTYEKGPVSLPTPPSQAKQAEAMLNRDEIIASTGPKPASIRTASLCGGADQLISQDGVLWLV